MEKFGTIKSIHLPKKETGKYVGYGFVTYEKMEDAVKAMNDLNARADKFIGTKVAVDWCLPKNIFLKNISKFKFLIRNGAFIFTLYTYKLSSKMFLSNRTDFSKRFLVNNILNRCTSLHFAANRIQIFF